MGNKYLRSGLLVLGIVSAALIVPSPVLAEGQSEGNFLHKKPVVALDVEYTVRNMNGVTVEYVRGVVPTGIKSFFVGTREDKGLRIHLTYDGVIGGGDGLGGEFMMSGLASDNGDVFKCDLASYEMIISNSKSNLSPTKDRENLNYALRDLSPQTRGAVLANPQWHFKLECSRKMRSPEQSS